MANVVARPEIQAKLWAEIRHVVTGIQLDDDEHLPQMPYLRAVVLEALWRHPSGRFMVPHAATEEGGVTLHGFRVLRHMSVNFTQGDMAMDEAVWPEPQRFLLV
jgi:cytochrome P450